MPPLDAPDPRLHIYADHANADADDASVSQLTGAVRVTQNGREIVSDDVNYDDADKRVRTDSQSVFRDRRIAIRSQRADYDINTSTGIFTENDFALRQASLRGESQQIHLLEDGTIELHHASFTSCTKEHEAWLISAKEIDIDRDEGLGTANNATLIFQGVPILFTPYMQFPIDNLRHSGFLTPIIGNNNNTGFDFRAPFYLNLGPNYDATLTPRYMSDRGEQIAGKLRYVTDNSLGYALGEYIPHDEELGTDRHFIDIQHEGLLSKRLGLSVKYAEVGDINYFSDLGGGVDLSSTPYLERAASLTYQAPTSYTVEALVEGYQPLASIDDQDVNPYKRLPQISLDALTKNSLLDTRVGFDGQYTNFARPDSVEGQRLVADPYIRWQKDRASWYASAQGDLSYTAYELTNNTPGAPDEPRRTLPIVSAESGLRFERLMDSGTLQTLEPRLFYLFVPFRDQDNLPLFDSGLPDFDFPQLFATNRFSGLDRISDANQLTSVLTTRLIDPDLGIERLSASAGNIYRFRDPQVTLPGTDQPSTGSSDYIGSVDYQLNRTWAASSFLEISPGLDHIARSSVELRYRDQELGKLSKRFDVAYRYREGILEQTDASFSSPITANWRLAARLRYSLRDSESLESFGGVEYENCCWAFSTTYRRYISNSNGEFNTGIYFQLVLKGLGTLGKNFETLLPTDDPTALRRR